MDWLTVFTQMGGATAFANAAKHAAEKVVEQAIASRLSFTSEAAKLAQASVAEHRALMARTQLEVIGALLEAIYPLKLALDRLNMDSSDVDWRVINNVVATMGPTIRGLEANLGGKRPFIPPPFDGRVHSFKNHLYSVRASVSDKLHRTRGRRGLPPDMLAHLRQHVPELTIATRELFAELVREAQRRIAGDGTS